MEETPSMFFGREIYYYTMQDPRGNDMAKLCFNNYMRQYRKRYLEHYTEEQILEAASEQWEKLSLIHQFQYNLHSDPAFVDINCCSELPAGV